MEGVVNATTQPLYPVPIVQEDGYTPRPFWTGAENLAPTGILSRDCPARSKSQRRLRYLGLTVREERSNQPQIMQYVYIHSNGKSGKQNSQK